MNWWVKSKNVSFFTGVLIICLSLCVHLTQSTLVISWDVYGYYLYLPAVFKYYDTSQYLFAYERNLT